MSIGQRSASAENRGPLEEVLEAERTGAATIEAARRDADTWLAAEKLAIQRASDAELALLDERHAADIDGAKRAAASRAAAIVAAAEAYARDVQTVRDEELLTALAAHLPAILPGGLP